MCEPCITNFADSQETTTQVETRRERTQHQYWYDGAYETLVSGLRQENRAVQMKNYFLVLFLEPLTLPHSKTRGENAVNPTAEEIARRQADFLTHQLEFVRGYEATCENALEQFMWLRDDCIMNGVEDYNNYSNGLIIRTETHQNAERFLSFFQQATEAQIADLRALYQRELELMFHNPDDQNFLQAKTRAWYNWLVDRGVEVPGLQPERERAGEILLDALLVQALDAPGNRQRFPYRDAYLPVVERILGVEIAPPDKVEEITIPAELFTELFVAICQMEPFTVERGELLLSGLQTQPKRSCQTERLLLRQAVQFALEQAQQAENQAWENRDLDGVNAASEQKKQFENLLGRIREM